MKRTARNALRAGLGATLTLLASVAPANAFAAGPGKLTVSVIRDVDADGLYTPARELGVAGVRVRVTDIDENSFTVTTKADGTVEVPTAGTTGQFRLQLLPDTLPDYLQPAFAGKDLSSSIAVVNVAKESQTVRFGVWNPADYCQVNADLTTTCQQAQVKVDGSRSLVTFNNDWRGNSNAGAPQPKTLAAKGDTGTTYGLAYDKKQRRIFQGAYAKRGTTYGPGGSGAIYVTPRDGGATTEFTKLDAGSTKHNPADNARYDGDFIKAVGKEGLGDIDISEKGDELYVVDMKDRKLYTFDATKSTADAPKNSIAIPDPGCTNPDDWRPMGLGVRDGIVYVGGVCSAQSTQKADDLRAVVWTYDPRARAFSDKPVLNQKLDRKRGQMANGQSATWTPWTPDDPNQYPASVNGTPARPQPMLSDIAIEANGDLALGFRDRQGDLGGYQMVNPNPAHPTVDTTVTAGDINKVCRTATGTFVWEGTDGCPAHKAQSGDKFYTGDNWGSHDYRAQGALALSQREGKIASTYMDPAHQANSGGVNWHDRVSGAADADGYGIQYLSNPVQDPNSGGFAKANGLGDLEYLCDQPPVQIGNRVWYDPEPGTQNADETSGIPGVTVTLLSEDGKTLATKKTDAKGEYYFSSLDVPALTAHGKYKVRFDKSTADLSTVPIRGNNRDISKLRWTEPYVDDASGNSEIDSKATYDKNSDTTAETAVFSVGDWGSVKHNLDAGMYYTR
ncbi:SdrD B-like domain-containing protein [Streptomyces gamaensis]|uniref:SdrD B-like domain-containing protein n=1 Tax=Streptomyces gamaensis TaxID=1763542 RepID=A0ABW0YZ07_9ACTN